MIASCMGIEVYKDTTSRWDGYGSVLLVVKSPAWMYLMSSRLFSKCAGTSFSFGLRALASNHGCVRLDALGWSIGVSIVGKGRKLISGPVLWILMRW